MNINDYYIEHGMSGLEKLAQASNTKLSYLKQLIYTEGKLPSINMAQRLVDASEGKLTFVGLANPVKRLPRDLKIAADQPAQATA
jgi:hypothetical protein